MRNNKHCEQNSIKYSGTPQHLRLMEMTLRLIVEYKKQESRYCIKEEIRSRISATQRTCTFKMFLCCIGKLLVIIYAFVDQQTAKKTCLIIAIIRTQSNAFTHQGNTVNIHGGSSVLLPGQQKKCPLGRLYREGTRKLTMIMRCPC